LNQEAIDGFKNGEISFGSLKNIIIDDDVYIGDYCFIDRGSSIARECYLSHASEFWGVLMRRVYLYHYMEMYGVIGENTDIGAGTVCGTLRFDDNRTQHNIKGKKQIPNNNSNAIFLGDYSRTGVNAVLLPGVKTGVYSLVGPGVVLSKDLPSKKSVFVKQELIYGDFSPEKYGW
jgi:bifunctional UDP-N-acetylglucosamine pyrophosphorylase/glucosamine-1-phosphate N-acetyltransferase